MDIETFIKDNVHVAFAISWFDGTIANSYYMSDYKDSESMIISCIKEIMIKKYDNYKVYIQNLSGFDANFLLKIMVNLGEIKPIIIENKIISINFKMNGYIVTFKDSQQMLNVSLRELAKSFKVDTQKSIFPYSFVNENNLDYIGQIPDFKYFNGISSIDYNCYIENYNIWNLRDETIRYCEIDCKSLFEVLVKFNELIFDKFKINIHRYPTLSSLAFAIFRSNYLQNSEIPQLSGQIANEIREGYTGGAVDMYIPFNEDGENIYAYDVNSLYPFIMFDKAMPVAKPIYFEGNIREQDDNAFGFFYCNIKTPDNLEHPIIQTHIKTEDGIRTMAPLGNWSDMIFSEEMDNAVKYGYKFEILWGYKFKREFIFKDYVDTLYQLRQNYTKSSPLNYTAKLLLNSLYGRFGMDDNFSIIEIIDSNEKFEEFENKVLDGSLEWLELGDKILIKYKTHQNQVNTALDGYKETHNVNVAIASAITAYARIHMTQFKNNPDYTLYYSDTDSIYLNKKLPDNMVSSTILGKMKLENILNKAIFLAPKVYYLETEDDKVIYKVKGLTHEVELTKKDFENLLFRHSFLEKFQTKWRKNLSKGNISILNEAYTLKVTTNKRKLIYENNKLVTTQPYIINKDEQIIIN